MTGVCSPIIGDKKGTLKNLRKHTLTKYFFSESIPLRAKCCEQKNWYFFQHKMVSKKIVNIILVYFENKAYFEHRRKIDFDLYTYLHITCNTQGRRYGDI